MSGIKVRKKKNKSVVVTRSRSLENLKFGSFRVVYQNLNTNTRAERLFLLIKPVVAFAVLVGGFEKFSEKKLWRKLLKMF